MLGYSLAWTRALLELRVRAGPGLRLMLRYSLAWTRALLELRVRAWALIKANVRVFLGLDQGCSKA